MAEWDQGEEVGKIFVVYKTSVSLVVEPATHLVVTTRSTPRSVTAAAHSDDENRTLYDGQYWRWGQWSVTAVSP